MSLGWNYRLVYHPPSTTEIGGKRFPRDGFLAIHECYYNDDDEVYMMTLDPIVIGDEGDSTVESLKWILEHQLECLEKPILDKEMRDGIFKEIPKEKQDELSESIENKETYGSEDSSASD